MAARIVTFVNQKGGVGKTTTAVSIAAALGRRGQRVLLVDLDPQANATSAAGVDPTVDRPGVYEALLDEISPADCVVPVPDEQIDVVPASTALAGAEVELVPVMARERRLSNALNALRDRYDWIFIDCPPSLGLLTINALTSSDNVVIPVQCEYMALEGLSRLMQTLDLVRRNLNPGLAILGVVLTMYDPRTRLSQQVVDEVRTHFPQTFQTIIPRAVRLSEAPSHGQSIFRYDPGGRAAVAYDALAGEMLARVGVAV
ncbi:MAG: ParA family protein [Dehalococcoidia bacterium]|nr:ParA family protein [Dehalococcoidia bacterium]